VTSRGLSNNRDNSNPFPIVWSLWQGRKGTTLLLGEAVVLGPNVPATLQRTRLTQGDQRLQEIGDELGIGPLEEPGQLFRGQSARMLGEHGPAGLGLLGQGLGPGALVRLHAR